MKIDWRDCSSYRRGVEAEQNCWQAYIGKYIRVTVTNGHIDFAPQWSGAIVPFVTGPFPLPNAVTVDDAKAEILRRVKLIVDDINAGLE